MTRYGIPFNIYRSLPTAPSVRQTAVPRVNLVNTEVFVTNDVRYWEDDIDASVTFLTKANDVKRSTMTTIDFPHNNYNVVP